MRLAKRRLANPNARSEFGIGNGVRCEAALRGTHSQAALGNDRVGALGNDGDWRSLLALAGVFVRDDAGGVIFQNCPDGLCEPALLCPPWTEWDEANRQCRQVAFCPGQSQVQIPGGPCVLHCRAGSEPDPFRPNYCRPAFQCPPGRVEIEPNVCEIPCPVGERQNPWRQGVCRKPFQCPFGQVEVAEGVCCPGGFCECPRGEGGDQCRELDRSHGAVAVNLHFAHEQTTADGTPLLGEGVSIAVMEAGALHWIPEDPGRNL